MKTSGGNNGWPMVAKTNSDRLLVVAETSGGSGDVNQLKWRI